MGDPRRGAVPAEAHDAPLCRQGRDGRRQLVLVPRSCWSSPSPGAFQGWRYLTVTDAPRDLDRAAPGAKAMPEALRRELRELGLL